MTVSEQNTDYEKNVAKVCKLGKRMQKMSVHEKNAKEGWGWLSNSKKWHYFINGRSICGKWLGLGLGELEQGNDNSPDNCSACKRAVAKRKAKQKVKELEQKGKLEF